MKPSSSDHIQNILNISVFLMIFLLSGCGSLTKMRYSPGYKCNIELNLGKKQKEEGHRIASRAFKRQTPVSVTNVSIVEGTAPLSQPKMGFRNYSESTSEIKRIQSHLPAQTGVRDPLQRLDKNRASHYSTGLKSAFGIFGKTSLEYDDPKPPYEKNSKWALILFLLSFPTSFIGIGGILMIVAFILAIIGRRKIKRSPEPLRGLKMDNAIIIIYIILFILSLIALYFYILGNYI